MAEVSHMPNWGGRLLGFLRELPISSRRVALDTLRTVLRRVEDEWEAGYAPTVPAADGIASDESGPDWAGTPAPG